MEPVKGHLIEPSVHVEVVLLAALISVCRSFLPQDFQTADPLLLIGLGAGVVALSGGYFLLKKALNK